jgi:hypothetical protein
MRGSLRFGGQPRLRWTGRRQLWLFLGRFVWFRWHCRSRGTVDIHDSSVEGRPDDGSTETGSGLIDANVVDMNGGDAIDAPVDADESCWKDWNGFWPLASGSTTNGNPGTTPDVSGHGYNATYGSGIDFGKSGMNMYGGGSGAVSMAARSSVAAVDAAPSQVPVVDVNGSYSVSAWVTMTDTSSWRTFVSADGTQVSSFYLQKREDSACFAFTLLPTDTNAGTGLPCYASASSIKVAANTPYHLVGTRNAETGIDILYVDGVAVGTATCHASSGYGWRSSTFGIGHGMYGGRFVDSFAGTISNVGLIGRVLTPAEVAALYALGPGPG